MLEHVRAPENRAGVSESAGLNPPERKRESLEKKCGCLSRKSLTANRKGSNYGTSQAFADTGASAKAPLVHPDLSHHHTLRFSVAT